MLTYACPRLSIIFWPVARSFRRFGGIVLFALAVPDSL